MAFNIIQFDKLLAELKKQISLEEQLSKIVRDIETVFDYTSFGIFLKVENSELFRLKISRKISYEFTKNTIFTIGDPLINELNEFQILKLEEPGRYVMEHDYSQLLIFPIHFKSSLLGFFFIDRKEGSFDIEEMTQLNLFVSLISFVVKLKTLEYEMEHQEVSLGKPKILDYRKFLQLARNIFSLMERYKRDLALVIIKIGNFEDFLRTNGEDKTNKIKKEIGNQLKSNLRETDIIGMLHKNAFAVLIPETSEKNCMLPLERLKSILADILEENKLVLGYGVSINNDNIPNVDQLLTLADKAADESARKGNEATFTLNQ